MIKKHKILCVFLSLMVSVSAFSACGNKSAPYENTVEDIASNINTDDTASKKTDTSDSDKTVMYISGAEEVEFSTDDSDKSKASSKLSPGSEVEVDSEDISSDYTRVYSREEKETGYVSSIYLVPDKSAVTSGETLIVKAPDTQMFSESGGSGDVIKVLTQGEEVSVLAKTSGGFWKVKTADGSVGYVNVEKLGNTAETETYVESYSAGGNYETTITDSVSQPGVTDSVSSSNNIVIEDVPQSVPERREPNPDVGSNTDFRSAYLTAQNSAGGNWAAAYIDLNTDGQTIINDSQMQAASLIKLYIMGAIYEDYDKYAAQDGNLDSYLYSMITVSDNSAANALVGILGGGDTNAGKNAVTSYSQSHGYNFTSMGRLLLESTINGDNYTSVGDCAKFMAAVYNGELPHSNEMLNLLKQQQRTSKIPAGVPYGVQTANKTGELPQVQNDAAIVFADQPYVFCVMSENVGEGSAVSAIVQFSKDVYQMSNE